ncbi:DUF4268 domain-containing protein [Phragmitibacter flavus]|uniref:DUF4268 domain-containing protein n=1 Tax=Phragmitibacter flavus TaxID=2576071 RepID=A0A5R8KJP2_9BACT|nr:DUF4268 domain-containing protein [Phragmitibacter flavus]TLD72471.1 DUF4268 domain-containing protein [Phragmitibacter flavus]
MPLYEMTSDAFLPLARASFANLKVRERDDLQRLLRTQIDVLGDDLYVLTEEFGDWDESRRRIDLLAIDTLANLVVVELKRTNDGGHMELQAIRYASMVSAMTFDRAEQIHANFLSRIGQPADEARTRMLDFLGWENPEEESFAPDVRIVLVSEDFGKELTTAVLWLRERDIDIRCVRLRPYLDAGKHLIDVQQIIPLPEANEYQVQLREKEQVDRKRRVGRHDERLKFWETLIAMARTRQTRHAHRKPGTAGYLSATSGVAGLSFNYAIGLQTASTELYIDRGNELENKSIFEQLLARKDEIEATFGAPLLWEPLETKRACRIKDTIERGGYRSPESEWTMIQSSMIDSMIKLEAALKPGLSALGI